MSSNKLEGLESSSISIAEEINRTGNAGLSQPLAKPRLFGKDLTYAAIPPKRFPRDPRLRWRWAINSVRLRVRFKLAMIGLTSARVSKGQSVLERIERIEEEIYNIPLELRVLVNNKSLLLSMKTDTLKEENDKRISTLHASLEKKLEAVDTEVLSINDQSQMLLNEISLLQTAVKLSSEGKDTVTRNFENLFAKFEAEMAGRSAKANLEAADATDRTNLLLSAMEHCSKKILEATEHVDSASNYEMSDSKFCDLLKSDSNLRKWRAELKVLQSNAIQLRSYISRLRFDAETDNLKANLSSADSKLDYIMSMVEKSDKSLYSHDCVIGAGWDILVSSQGKFEDSNSSFSLKDMHDRVVVLEKTLISRSTTPSESNANRNFKGTEKISDQKSLKGDLPYVTTSKSQDDWTEQLKPLVRNIVAAYLNMEVGYRQDGKFDSNIGDNYSNDDGIYDDGDDTYDESYGYDEGNDYLRTDDKKHQNFDEDFLNEEDPMSETFQSQNSYALENFRYYDDEGGTFELEAASRTNGLDSSSVDTPSAQDTSTSSAAAQKKPANLPPSQVPQGGTSNFGEVDTIRHVRPPTEGGGNSGDHSSRRGRIAGVDREIVDAASAEGSRSEGAYQNHHERGAELSTPSLPMGLPSDKAIRVSEMITHDCPPSIKGQKSSGDSFPTRGRVNDVNRSLREAPSSEVDPRRFEPNIRDSSGDVQRRGRRRNPNDVDVGREIRETPPNERGSRERRLEARESDGDVPRGGRRRNPNEVIRRGDETTNAMNRDIQTTDTKPTRIRERNYETNIVRKRSPAGPRDESAIKEKDYSHHGNEVEVNFKDSETGESGDPVRRDSRAKITVNIKNEMFVEKEGSFTNAMTSSRIKGTLPNQKRTKIGSTIPIGQADSPSNGLGDEISFIAKKIEQIYMDKLDTERGLEMLASKASIGELKKKVDVEVFEAVQRSLDNMSAELGDLRNLQKQDILMVRI